MIGTYPLTIMATASVTHSVTVTLTVISGSPDGRGDVASWNATTAHVPDDVVSHNGRLWKSTWWSTNAEPGAPGSWARWTDPGAR